MRKVKIDVDIVRSATFENKIFRNLSGDINFRYTGRNTIVLYGTDKEIRTLQESESDHA